MIPIIFIHYGNTPYLRSTLKSSQISNPYKKKILIGDKSNKQVAQENGWTHFELDDLKSEKREKFNSIFYWVQGRYHNPIRAGKDWLRFGFDRFFALESLIIKQKIKEFWHFDSDTMIVRDLSKFEGSIKYAGIDATTLCDGKCQAGYMNAKALEEYTNVIIEDYEDKDFLNSLIIEFTKRPYLAFVEFRSFVRLIDKGNLHIKQLSSLFSEEGIWFDDCICQRQGFKLFYYPKLSTGLKDLYFRNNEFLCKKKDNMEFKFASINCSWVDNHVFNWVIINLETSGNIPNRLENYLIKNKRINLRILLINFFKRLNWNIFLTKSFFREFLRKIYRKHVNF